MRAERRQVAYAATESAYRALWSAVVGVGDPPPVDFGREGVLFLAAGQRPTGGYAVSLKSVRLEGGEIVVEAPVQAPPADAMVTQALTYPFLVVAIPRVEAAKVQWENAADILDQQAPR